MRARSTCFALFLVAATGCGTGSVGPMGGAGENPGSGSGGGSSSGGGGSASGGGGEGSGNASSGGGTAGSGGSSSGSTSSPVVSEQTWRLTDTEYANTVNDLLTITPAQQTVPLVADSAAGGFAVGSEQGDNVAQAYHDSAVAIATLAVANNGATLLQPAGCSISAGASCVTTFLNYFLPIAYRHGTPSSTQVSELVTVYNTVSAASGGTPTLGLQAVVEAILNSPYFLYKLETEEQALGAGQVSVTGYSMANRLSYLLWASMPDSTLFTAAKNAQLSTAAQVSTQATRMIASAKAHIGLANFSSQWLQPVPLASTKDGNSTQITTQGALSQTSLFNYNTSLSTGESFSTVYTQAVQDAIQASFSAQVDAALWSASGAMKTLLTGTTVYANAALAPIFGVTATGTTLTPVQLPSSSQRVGILSHPLVMATYATPNTSHPIKRGRWVWDQIMCQPLPDPPPNVPPFSPPTAGMSLRQDYEKMTATGPFSSEPQCATVGATSLADGGSCLQLGTDGQPLACPTCHSRINPVGFLFEPFDTLGDYRTIDDYGQPVDLTNITIVQSADPNLNVPTPNSTQFAQNLAGSDVPNACLTEFLYEFMAHRGDTAADYAAEGQLDTTFTNSNQSLVPVLVQLTQMPAFLNRMNVK